MLSTSARLVSCALLALLAGCNQSFYLPSATLLELVPYACGERLAAAAPTAGKQFWRVESDCHLGTFQQAGSWRRRLQQWLAGVLR